MRLPPPQRQRYRLRLCNRLGHRVPYGDGHRILYQNSDGHTHADPGCLSYPIPHCLRHQIWLVIRLSHGNCNGYEYSHGNGNGIGNGIVNGIVNGLCLCNQFSYQLGNSYRFIHQLGNSYSSKFGNPLGNPFGNPFVEPLGDPVGKPLGDRHSK